MITRQRIIGKADEDGIPASTVERDYVLTHCLVAVSRLPEAGNLVFKGGTAYGCATSMITAIRPISISA